MHSTFFASSVLLLFLSSTTSSVLAKSQQLDEANLERLAQQEQQIASHQSHDGLLKQNHHRFVHVKRGGATLHLIGDETVARWNGGSVAALPKPSVVAPIVTTTSYSNLMDSINAGLGVPVGRPTASSSSSALASPVLAISTSSSSSSKASSSSSSKASSSSSSSSKASSSSSSSSIKTTSSKSTSSSVPASTSSKAATVVALAAGRGAALAVPTKSAAAHAKRHVAFNATVAEGVDEDHIQALGRRATGNATLALGRGAAIKASSSVVLSSSASASSDIPVAQTQAAVSFSAADLGTSQGWGAAFANKYTSMSVNNHAVRGASARSVYRDMWTSILSTVKSGDIVVFQLGHYDSLQPGSAQDTAEGCIGSVPGSGDDSMTITSGCTGGQEVVKTFYAYMTEMCSAVKSKGATCLIASLTPKNKFSGSALNYNSPYTSQAKAAAAAAGGTYVPHLETIGKQVTSAGGIAVAANYWLNGDALQSNAAGADAFASAFAAAAGCAGASGVSLTAAGKAVQGSC